VAGLSDMELGPKGRTSHAACRDDEYKDKFYVFGGSGKNIGFENYNDLWYFDFATLKFTEILVGKASAFRPPGMYGHSLTFLNGSLYVFGGTTGFDYFKDIFKFDLYSFQWQKLQVYGSSDLEPRYKHSAVLNPDDKKLIIVGGLNQSTRLGNIFEFNFDKRQWSPLLLNKNKHLFKGRYGHTAHLVEGNRQILIFGGTEEEQKNDLIKFDIMSGNF
jgi:N-acetylneuraminic acid mutarotase